MRLYVFALLCLAVSACCLFYRITGDAFFSPLAALIITTVVAYIIFWLHKAIAVVTGVYWLRHVKQDSSNFLHVAVCFAIALFIYSIVYIFLF